jgi:hypothetical protein
MLFFSGRRNENGRVHVLTKNYTRGSAKSLSRLCPALSSCLRVANGIPLGCPPPLTAATVNSVQPLKEWLASALATSTADVHLIVSSLQVLPAMEVYVNVALSLQAV